MPPGAVGPWRLASLAPCVAGWSLRPSAKGSAVADSQHDASQDLVVIVVYAEPTHAWQREVHVAPGSTVNDALTASGIGADYPALDLHTSAVGIFGRPVAHTTVLTNGDRVEIYRALVFDPMVSRRRRAAHRALTTKKH